MTFRKKQAFNIMKDGGESKENAKENIDKMNMRWSEKYNPFNYIREPKDIDTIADILALADKLLVTNSDKASMIYYSDIRRLWLKSSIGYIWGKAPKEEQNVLTLREFLEFDEAEVGEKSDNNAVDMLFRELEEKEPDHFAVVNRNKYKNASRLPAISFIHIINFLYEEETQFSDERESVRDKLRKYRKQARNL